MDTAELLLAYMGIISGIDFIFNIFRYFSDNMFIFYIIVCI